MLSQIEFILKSYGPLPQGRKLIITAEAIGEGAAELHLKVHIEKLQELGLVDNNDLDLISKLADALRAAAQTAKGCD